VRSFASLDRSTQVYFVTVIALGLAVIPVGWLAHSLASTDLQTLIYLAVGFVFHPLAGVPVFGR